jgi:membrane associated rhomboid family serine protease
MTSPAAPEEAMLPPGPPPLSLAVALDLVTRYRLRLTDPRDGRLGPLGGDAYVLGAAAWTGRRAAFVGFYQPPDDPDAAARDLEQRLRAAESWGNERLGTQGAERCDILLVALGSVGRVAPQGTGLGGVHAGAMSVDTSTGDTQVVVPGAGNLPSAGEVRAHARAVLQGRPVPTLAAVDLAERQTVAGGYSQPTRSALTAAPVLTYGLIVAFVVVWLVERNFTAIPNDNVRLFAFGALADSGPPAGDWWRYVSSAFLHEPGSPLHILFNGVAMFYIGRLVEQLYGRMMLAGVFLITAACGGLFWVLCADAGIAGKSLDPGIGASGGIMGLIGLLAMLGRTQGRDVPVGVVASLRQYAITFVVLTILVGLFVSNTNNFAHVGGLIGGVLLGLVLPPRTSVGGRELRLWEKAVLGSAVVAAAVALGLAAHNVLQVYDAVQQFVPGLQG